MGKCVELCTINGQVYCELAEDYLLHVCSREFLDTLSGSQIVLLVNATIAAHERQMVH